MIDLKNPENTAPNLLTAAAFVILVGTLAFMLLAKPPQSVTGVTLQKRGKIEAIAKAQTKASEVRKVLAPKLWQGGSVQVTANILGNLTNEAARYGLTLTSFRPDTDKDLTGFRELKYTVQVSGPYPKVRSLLTSLDGGNDKVALGSVQIATSPNSAAAVQATLSLSAYLLTDQSLLPPASPTHSKRGAAHA
jgi:Tfp pilus assembly protein PilO